MNTVTYEMAQKAIAAALAKAKELGSPSSIAVIDHGRALVGFVRMDGALLASIDISQSKAYTARSLNSSTKDVGSWSQPGAPLYGLETAHLSAGRALIIFAGGVPITVKGEVVGAIGVAGGSPDQDHEVATVGAAALDS
jgi:uncharacterized protein GlcG (DUF336 family)